MAYLRDMRFLVDDRSIVNYHAEGMVPWAHRMPRRMLKAGRFWATCLTLLLCISAGKTPKTSLSDQPIVLSAAAPATTQPSPLPDAASRARAEKMIKEVFQREYASRTPADRQALARRLLQQAMETRDDPAARYVLLRESREMASGAGDAATAAAAVNQLERWYAIDAPAEMLVAMVGAMRATRAVQVQRDIARLALQAVDRAVLADDYNNAVRLCQVAQTAAENAANIVMLSAAKARARELQTTFAEYKLAQTARDRLRDRDNDPDAHLRVGRFLCFFKNDWVLGLDHLARGSDPTLARLARRDGSAPSGVAEQFDLANAWWDLGQAQEGLARHHIRGRAARWYRLALPGLAGLSRSVAEKRIETQDRETLRAMNMVPGLCAELHKGVDLSDCVKMRVDPMIDFDWGEESPDESLPKDNFSIRWTGLMRLTAAGRSELVVIANMGVRIWIDGTLVLDAPTLSRSRNGVRIPVEFGAGMHSLIIEYWDTSGAAKMRLFWRPPGTVRDEPIPASVFYHDACPIDRSAGAPE